MRLIAMTLQKIFQLLLLFSVTLTFFFSEPAFAQARKLRKADKALSLFQFDKAINRYTKIAKKHPDNYKALSSLADIYRITGDYENAVAWYGIVVKQAQCTPMQNFYYAQMLRTAEQYDSAKVYYLKYSDLAPNDSRGLRIANGMDMLPDLRRDSIKFRVKEYPHNTPGLEFSPAYYKNDSTIVFPTSRGTGKLDVWSDNPFLDLYVSVQNDTSFSEPVPIEGNVNKEFHEGPVVFDTSYTTMYFTRNNYIKKKKKSREGIMKLKVFKAVYKDNKWEEIADLPFNSDEYSVGHPTLTPDGKFMYFASDMPNANAVGGQDLYMVAITDSGFGEPVNLGTAINTKGDEVFPFYHPNGTLYFSSDSYEGFGGLDIYSATQSKGAWGIITNLGYPINSSKDDFGLIYNEKLEHGMFTSSRPGGAGSDDIYLFDKNTKVILLGKVIDKKTKEPIPDAMVYLKEMVTVQLDSLASDKKGKFKFPLEINKDFEVTTEKYGYFLASLIKVSTRMEGKDTIEIVIELQRIAVGEVVKLENIYYDFDKFDIRPDAAVELNRFVQFMNKYPGMEVELRSHTDSRGSDTYNQWLSQKRAESAVAYVIKQGIGSTRIKARGYGESMPVNQCVNRVPCTEEEHQMNRRTEFVVTKQPTELKVKSSVKD